jgi:uncharacterized cofD-like protein
VIIGPGSLYTSVLKNLLVDGIQKALAATAAMRMFVCNVATQQGETDGFDLVDHVDVIERHMGKGLLNAVIANSNLPTTPLPEAWHSSPVVVEGLEGVQAGAALPFRLRLGDVVAEENRYRHDPAKLAATIMGLYDDRGPVTAQARIQAAEAAVLAGR